MSFPFTAISVAKVLCSKHHKKIEILRGIYLCQQNLLKLKDMLLVLTNSHAEVREKLPFSVADHTILSALSLSIMCFHSTSLHASCPSHSLMISSLGRHSEKNC